MKKVNINSDLYLLSFDIEDWFQVENFKGIIKKDDWENKKFRVAENTEKLLDTLDKYNTKATFFILGWIAEKIPNLISQISRRGHEIASHGYNHDLIYNLTETEFIMDIRRSKNILEDIIGKEVIGYRAPSFSITDRALNILMEEGFKYDSSYFPILIHDNYGKLNSIKYKKENAIEKVKENFYEILIPTLDFLNIKVPWGGGGYFRFIPYPFYKIGVNKIIKTRRVFLFYLHPWEIDTLQPKLKNIGTIDYLRHYGGINGTENKLNKLLKDFSFIPIQEALKFLKLLEKN